MSGPRISRLAIFWLASAFSLMPAIAGGIGLDGKWLAEDINGGGVIDRLQTTLEVSADGAVSGSGGCNRFAGQAKISSESISFGPLAATEMMCPPATMDQEHKFFAALGKVAGWRIDQMRQKLVLTDAGGKPIVVFARMD